MPRPMNHNLGRPFWAVEERSSPAVENLLHELQTKGSRPGEAVVFNGLNSLGMPTFQRVPHRYPRTQF
jgi:hypothetical protein